MDRTSKLKNYVHVLTPTLPGVLLYVFLTGVGIILNQFNAINTYLQLPHDLDFGRILAGWADRLLSITIGESRTDILVVGLFWAGVGLVVYMFLQSIARLAVQLDENLQARGYVWPKGTDRYRPLRILAKLVAFRLMTFVCLILVVFGPLVGVLRGPILVDFLGQNAGIQLLFWFLVSVLIWHIVIILLRLLLLRPRLLR